MRAASFSPPSAPHFNGLREAGIKSVRMHLLKILDGHTLTYEEFYTILVQVGTILSSRPLYVMNSDTNYCGVITPGHFLTLEPDLFHLKMATFEDEDSTGTCGKNGVTNICIPYNNFTNGLTLRIPLRWEIWF
ncbi:hypothetical protein JTB14_037084 [Gonioctena quinquepunctata]|nr:hypothetical protein JTB14_037084 [Gonioctena quinquepunctata]